MNLPKNKAGIPSTLKVEKGISNSRNKSIDLSLNPGDLVTLQALKVLTYYDDSKIQSLLNLGILAEPSKEDIASRDIISLENIQIKEKELQKDEKTSYLQILKDSELLKKIDAELDKKIEGEHDARLAIFMTLNMRNVANLNKSTDNLMTNDEGGTGKDYVVSAVFSLIPDSEKVKKVRITPKVLAYLNDIRQTPNGWEKKCLYLEDVPDYVLNDDAFKVMCSADSNGITQTSIVVNNSLRDIDIRGKPSIVITIATTSPKPELLRRFPIVNLTSTEKQTKAILRKQAEFAMKGVSPEYDSRIKNALGLLKRVKVKIPFADKISNIFPYENIIIRTHFPRFLDYIRSSCALHQFQREKDSEGFYIASSEDYEIAKRMLMASTSNQLMIPHTKLQKRILENFSKLNDSFYTFTELEKEMQNLTGGRWLRKQLEVLVEQGFLERGNEKREGSIKPCAVYKFNAMQSLVLPGYEELNNCSNNTSYTFNSNKSNSSNKEEKGSPSNLNNLHYLHSELESEKYTFLLSLLNQDGKKPEFETQQLIELGVTEDIISKAKERGECFEPRPGSIQAL